MGSHIRKLYGMLGSLQEVSGVLNCGCTGILKGRKNSLTLHARPYALNPSSALLLDAFFAISGTTTR